MALKITNLYLRARKHKLLMMAPRDTRSRRTLAVGGHFTLNLVKSLALRVVRNESESGPAADADDNIGFC